MNEVTKVESNNSYDRTVSYFDVLRATLEYAFSVLKREKRIEYDLSEEDMEYLFNWVTSSIIDENCEEGDN